MACLMVYYYGKPIIHYLIFVVLDYCRLFSFAKHIVIKDKNTFVLTFSVLNLIYVYNAGKR